MTNFRYHGKNAGQDRLTLQCESGSYEVTGSRFPFARLVLLVLRHRTWHLLRGEGWSD